MVVEDWVSFGVDAAVLVEGVDIDAPLVVPSFPSDIPAAHSTPCLVIIMVQGLTGRAKTRPQIS